MQELKEPQIISLTQLNKDFMIVGSPRRLALNDTEMSKELKGLFNSIHGFYPWIARRDESIRLGTLLMLCKAFQVHPIQLLKRPISKYAQNKSEIKWDLSFLEGPSV